MSNLGCSPHYYHCSRGYFNDATYQLTINGNPIELRNRLLNMQVVDKDGMEADQLTLDIDDADGSVEIPSKGVVVGVTFGYNWHSRYIGTFVVDEVSHHGPPDVLTIRASSADFRRSLLEEREISYHATTLGAIIGSVAARNTLESAINGDLASITIEHLDQTNESDANLISRLAVEHDAVGTVKDGRLVFIPRASGKTANGQALPVVTIERSAGDTHEYSDADRDERVTGVIAYYQDKKKGRRKKVTVGSDGYCRHLKQTYNSEKEAREAAAGKFKRIQTRSRKLTINLAIGRPELIAELPIITRGYKPQIDQIHWFAAEITHTLNEKGLTTSIRCEEMQK
ncbi:contractile injection system protein, VgrG/Pvc8 family [Rappaport israeli]|uniref:contractile injection system protein, VgrG/Pvc8 family n=1 Tax=Rappaport israeli TaxID=1839807 RepID=UPI00098F7580|nr:contractile injection system protein, VgrG/Pvc8 family [Rappaport israeli]